MLKSKNPRRQLALLTLLLAATGSAHAQTSPSTTVQFVARGMQPTPKEVIQGDSHALSAGHVFMIISIPTLHGPKEEAYGFYPKNDTLTGVIKGPGMPKSEYRCGTNDDCSPSNYAKFLKHFSESDDSVRIPITEDQRKKIISEIDTWDHKEYRFTSESCMDFVNAAVKNLGYPPVPRYPIQRPTEFLERLRRNIAVEDERRERERQQIQQHEIEEAAKQRDTNDHCESGVFVEINPILIWNVTINGDVITGVRMDRGCTFTGSRNGETWTVILSPNGYAPSTLVLRANESCTQLNSNTPTFRLTRR